jgi:hypothetical protein
MIKKRKRCQNIVFHGRQQVAPFGADAKRIDLTGLVMSWYSRVREYHVDGMCSDRNNSRRKLFHHGKLTVTVLGVGRHDSTIDTVILIPKVLMQEARAVVVDRRGGLTEEL